jgi:hypothetical protein
MAAVQYVSSPVRQLSQVWQTSTMGLKPARWPTFKLFTRSPTCTITPAPSCPAHRVPNEDILGIAQSFIMKWMSLMQRPVALSLMSTSSGPGTGTSTSTTSYPTDQSLLSLCAARGTLHATATAPATAFDSRTPGLTTRKFGPSSTTTPALQVFGISNVGCDMVRDPGGVVEDLRYGVAMRRRHGPRRLLYVD